jgi:hypothetical protein
MWDVGEHRRPERFHVPLYEPRRRQPSSEIGTERVHFAGIVVCVQDPVVKVSRGDDDGER